MLGFGLRNVSIAVQRRQRMFQFHEYLPRLIDGVDTRETSHAAAASSLDHEHNSQLSCYKGCRRPVGSRRAGARCTMRVFPHGDLEAFLPGVTSALARVIVQRLCHRGYDAGYFPVAWTAQFLLA